MTDVSQTGRSQDTGRGEAKRRRVLLGGTAVDLLDKEAALEVIVSSARHCHRPLGVASANLDHIFHFGVGSRWKGVLEEGRGADWLTLLDGHPLVRQAARLTGRRWPRLAGSDLIDELLSRAEVEDLVVGFLGGRPESHERLRLRIARDWPRLVVGGYWAPDRAQLTDPWFSRGLTIEIRESRVQMLFVGLGKPRQEVWIAEHARATGAGVLLAFGAAADFVSGTAIRAPRVLADGGIEWLWRLAHEPRRLARRYLGEGPGAYLVLRTESSVLPNFREDRAGRSHESDAETPAARSPSAGVTALVVTFNSADRIGPLLQDLEGQIGSPRLRIVVIDNCSTDSTRRIVRESGTAELIEAEANLGYAGAVNLGLSHVSAGEAVLVLNPDLRLPPRTLSSLWQRMLMERAGVVVPAVEDQRGVLCPSLRFEPTLLRDFFDALLGARLSSRPPWSTESDFSAESYQWAHTVDWATGAALLVSADVVSSVGPWSEDFFLYSEETDFLRRVREAGFKVWFEPEARVTHEGEASGASPELDALRAVNRVRYAELHHGQRYAFMARLVVILSALVRAHRAEGHRRALHYLLRRETWSELPSRPRPGVFQRAAGGS